MRRAREPTYRYIVETSLLYVEQNAPIPIPTCGANTGFGIRIGVALVIAWDHLVVHDRKQFVAAIVVVVDIISGPWLWAKSNTEESSTFEIITKLLFGFTLLFTFTTL